MTREDCAAAVVAAVALCILGILLRGEGCSGRQGYTGVHGQIRMERMIQ